jgi:hypothetical protein
MASSPESTSGAPANTPRGILKPEPQRFPSQPFGLPPNAGMPMMPMSLGHMPACTAVPLQYQHMFPGYPPQTGYTMPPSHGQHLIQHHPAQLNNPPPGPTQPPGGFQGGPLPTGARAISPPRYPTRDDLKYKCSICGRFRSAKYHYLHPLAPGQWPPPTVCTKCRNASSDTEDDISASDESVEYQSRPRRAAQSRSRSASRTHRSYVASRPRSSNRNRQPVAWSDEDDYDYRPTRPLLRSSSFHGARSARSRSVASRRSRNRSPSVEEIEVVRRPGARRIRRIIYVDDDGHEVERHESPVEDEEVEVRTYAFPLPCQVYDGKI